MAYGLESRRLPRGEVARRVQELLDLVGLPDQGPKYPSQLSGGQQQRVAVARALAPSPRLLLLDEPLSALDAKVRVHLRHEIAQIQRRLGVTTIMVTHDQEEALTMADRIVVMNRGEIEQVGAPLEIYRSPASPFVADFIGSMNFVAGTVARPGAVRVGDAVLVVDTADTAPGADVTLAIRPEDVLVGVGGDNAVHRARGRGGLPGLVLPRGPDRRGARQGHAARGHRRGGGPPSRPGRGPLAAHRAAFRAPARLPSRRPS